MYCACFVLYLKSIGFLAHDQNKGDQGQGIPGAHEQFILSFHEPRVVVICGEMCPTNSSSRLGSSAPEGMLQPSCLEHPLRKGSLTQTRIHRLVFVGPNPPEGGGPARTRQWQNSPNPAALAAEISHHAKHGLRFVIFCARPSPCNCFPAGDSAPIDLESAAEIGPPFPVSWTWLRVLWPPRWA